MRWLVAIASVGLLGCTSNTIGLNDEGAGTQADTGADSGTSVPTTDGADAPVVTTAAPSTGDAPPTMTTTGVGSSTGDNPTTPPTTGLDDDSSSDTAFPPPVLPDGRFLLAMDSVISPGLPFQWEVNANAAAVSFAGQSLSLDSGSTTSPRELIGGIWEAVVSEDPFEITVPSLLILGAANPITGGEITVSQLLLQVTGVVDNGVYCGTVQGSVLMPIEVGLEGSTFALIPVAPGQAWPVDFPTGC